jgi:hypothetical protein
MARMLSLAFLALAGVVSATELLDRNLAYGSPFAALPVGLSTTSLCALSLH